MHNLFSNGKKENNGLVFLIRKLADNVQGKKVCSRDRIIR